MALLSPSVRFLLPLLIIKPIKSVEMIVLSRVLVAASMPTWLEWGFWVSPLSYGEIGLTVNEFLAPRWEKVKFNFYYLFYEQDIKKICKGVAIVLVGPIGQLQGSNLRSPLG